MIFIWVLIGLASMIGMAWASNAAVKNAVGLSERLKLPPYVIGVTLVAFGTDMPEIINSIVSSYMGHGDVNVGDSIGSVLVQSTLVLGIVGLATSKPHIVNRKNTFIITSTTVVALLLGVWLFGDGQITRLDAFGVLASWFVATAVAWRYYVVTQKQRKSEPSGTHLLAHAGASLGALLAVGIAAAALVLSITKISTQVGIPEYLISFFGSALGTSMPELIVNVTAIRQGHRQIAIGGVLGACFMDATFSVAIGPLLFPTAITPELVIRGSLIAALTFLAVGLLLGIRQKHDRLSGALLTGFYLFAYLLLL